MPKTDPASMPPSQPPPPSSEEPALRGRRVLLAAADPFDELLARDDRGPGRRHAGRGHLDDRRPRADPGPRVDAVLLDLELPGLAGAALPRVVRALRSAQRPLIALRRASADLDQTGRASADLDEAGRAGDGFDGAAFDAGLTKPLHPQGLLRSLAACLAGVPAPAAVVSSPPVSLALGLERCLGREDLYLRVVNRFLANSAHLGADIAQALGEDDRAAAARHAHSLISTAGTLGAMPLSQAARSLYSALAEAQGDAAAPLAALEAEVARVRGALLRFVESGAGTLPTA
ncbi:MAG: Hpt domain-containing protein [Rubrivivax sp.]